MLRKVIKENAERYTNLEGILPYLRGNTGLVFTHLELADARSSLMAIKVQRAAKAGAISPVDVTLPSGDTRLEPTKTSFFQALGIGTKIIKGSVSLASDVPLLKAGQRVTVSQAALLQMLNIKPFQYGLKVGMVYDNGDIYPSSISDFNETNMFQSIMSGITNVAAVSLEIGYPTQASVMFSMRAAMMNVMGMAAASGLSMPQLEGGAVVVPDEDNGDIDDDVKGGGDDDMDCMCLFGDEDEEAEADDGEKKKPQTDDGDDDDDPSASMGSIFGDEDEDY